MTHSSLKANSLPTFSNIQPTSIEPALKQLIAQNRTTLNTLLKQCIYTWDNFMEPLEEMDNQLSHLWSPVSHLHAVAESDALRAAYNACLPLLTEYHTELMQNESIYKAIQSIAESPAYINFNAAQRKVVDNALRDFKLAGVHLPPSEKARFAELQKQANKLSTRFSENILDSTHAWTLHITDPEALLGLPDQILKIAAQTAQQRELEGWVLTLDYSCYSTVMKNLAHRELRWLIYEAYVTRASDQGPNAGQWDNTKIMEDILKTRHEIANLVGFRNYADYSLATKMAKKPERVLQFLNDLVSKSKPAAIKEIQELTDFAKALDNIERLEAWDLAYYSEKLRQTKLALIEDDLRAYFPITKVLEGMFIVVNKLYGIKIIERHGIDVWHPNVQFFEIYDEKEILRGYFYTDLYARSHKRDGAWMDECQTRRRLADGTVQLPIAFLTCNFTRPLNNDSALLTHEDVQTLFHEFGHCLHHLLTQVDYAAVSGINGVPWDAVEFPSQFFEHWCWEKEVLTLISAHIETGEPLPDMLYNKLLSAKNFQPGMHMLRQLEFALFDFRVHREYDPSKELQVQAVLDEVREVASVIHLPAFNRFQHSFSHIFAGGYAAGYYSYKWAEVLSCDAYAPFTKKGIFDPATSRAFLNILEQGGVYDPMELYVAFRGQEPSIEALLEQSGLSV
ncbi:MAG: prlC [Gammaproteobacteria bacterium]|jgi:oligopeptidase A|nr:prlC [Gammaproteobacteria bacterium]